MWIKKNLIQALITSPMIFASLTGCTTFRERFEKQPYRVKQQDRAGSVHMAVVNVVPWAEVSKELEAKFPMNETIALNESIPTTQIEQQQLLDALKITLKLAFPTATFTDSKEAKSSTSESVTGTETDGKASEEKKSTSDKTETQTKTEKEKSGDTSSIDDP